MSNQQIKDRNIKLIIAGEAYESLDKYKSIINEYDINKNVIWIDDFLSDDMIEKLMTISDLLVLPYKTASQSGVLSQAWQYNLPSIVTDVGGLSEYVDEGRSGYIVDANNISVTERLKFPSIENLIELIPKHTPPRVKMFGSKYLVFFDETNLNFFLSSIIQMLVSFLQL